MKKIIKWVSLIIVVLIVVGAGALYIWSQQTYGPTTELLNLVDVEELVNDEGDVVSYPLTDSKAGIILYPGAKVENTAYSYYAQKLADAGYAVFIPKLRMNFALLDQNEAANIIDDNEAITKWYIGGHSLGGVAATMFAKNNPQIEGVILLASYPSNGTDLSSDALNVISVYGEKDGLTKLSDIESAKVRLPTATKYIEIKGGNHAQFGIYGEQNGDNDSNLTPIEQQDVIIEAIVDFLDGNS